MMEFGEEKGLWFSSSRAAALCSKKALESIVGK
jgi:hypothetical protein